MSATIRQSFVLLVTYPHYVPQRSLIITDQVLRYSLFHNTLPELSQQDKPHSVERLEGNSQIRIALSTPFTGAYILFI
jgi:hypothetical protein